MGNIVLNKLEVNPGLTVILTIKSLIKQPALIPVKLGFEQYNIG
jgi:hypothetical protein